jgi:hypothetical protein
MTDIAITHRKPTIADAIREAFVRLRDWLNEGVYAEPMPPEFAFRDWADLPVYHPVATPDDKGAR